MYLAWHKYLNMCVPNELFPSSACASFHFTYLWIAAYLDKIQEYTFFNDNLTAERAPYKINVTHF